MKFKILRNLQLLVAFTLLLSLSNCGGDKDNPKPKLSIKGSLSVSDLQYWPNLEDVMFGLYVKGEKTPKYKAELTKPSEKDFNFTIRDIEAGTYQVKLYIEEKTPVFELVDYGEINIQDVLSLPKKTITFTTYSRIQKQIFTSKCLVCHGNSEKIAANLDLRADKSYELLVNVQAKNSEKLRVKPNDVDGSFLIQVMKQINTPFHSAVTKPSDGTRELVENWIKDGAKNN